MVTRTTPGGALLLVLLVVVIDKRARPEGLGRVVGSGSLDLAGSAKPKWDHVEAPLPEEVDVLEYGGMMFLGLDVLVEDKGSPVDTCVDSLLGLLRHAHVALDCDVDGWMAAL